MSESSCDSFNNKSRHFTQTRLTSASCVSLLYSSIYAFDFWKLLQSKNHIPLDHRHCSILGWFINGCQGKINCGNLDVRLTLCSGLMGYYSPHIQGLMWQRWAPKPFQFFFPTSISPWLPSCLGVQCKRLTRNNTHPGNFSVCWSTGLQTGKLFTQQPLKPNQHPPPVTQVPACQQCLRQWKISRQKVMKPKNCWGYVNSECLKGNGSASTCSVYECKDEQI